MTRLIGLCHSWRHSHWSMHNSSGCDCMHDSSIVGDWVLLVFCLEFLYILMFMNEIISKPMHFLSMIMHTITHIQKTSYLRLPFELLPADFASMSTSLLVLLARLSITFDCIWQPQNMYNMHERGHPAQCGENYPATLTNLNIKFA